MSQFPDPESMYAIVETPPPPGRRVARAPRFLWREVLLTLMPAFLGALLFVHFVAQSSVVYGSSMEPGLHTGQRLLVEKVTPHLHLPARGEIVIIHVDGYDVPLIKRVIGLPGDTIKVRANQLFVNGEQVQEPYLAQSWQQSFGPLQVPPDHIFVLGDNRGVSNDSRYFGPIPIRDIMGHAWVSYWPLPDLGPVK